MDGSADDYNKIILTTMYSILYIIPMYARIREMMFYFYNNYLWSQNKIK